MQMSEELRAADEIDASFVPRAKPGVSGVVLDGETVVLDGETSVVLTLNATATLVWACFDGVATLDEVVADLAAEFAADEATIRRDVLHVTRELGNLGLLQGIAPSPPVLEGLQPSQTPPGGKVADGEGVDDR